MQVLSVEPMTCRYKQTPAHLAAYSGHPHCLQWLLRTGSDIQQQVRTKNIQYIQTLFFRFWLALFDLSTDQMKPDPVCLGEIYNSNQLSPKPRPYL